MRVLIADDSVYKRIAIRNALQEFCSVQTEMASDMETALEMAGSHSYDLLITDMDYPPVRGARSVWNSGEILIRRLREAGNPVPVIICSSENYSNDLAAACVWYHENGILSWDLKSAMKKAGLIR